MPWTDDPVYDAMMHDAEQDRKLRTLPECGECGERIQEEECYEINGELICPECMQNHKKWTEDYME